MIRNHKKYCGTVILMGRPNVGKSTLFNKLIGHKISITSNKPQTTKYSIVGVNTKDNYQVIYIDTPGLQIKKKLSANNLLKTHINIPTKRKLTITRLTTLIIFILEENRWTKDDSMIMHKINHLPYPVLLVINKIDKIHNKNNLLPYIKFLSNQMKFIDIIPISAEKDLGINIVNQIVRQNMPESSHQFTSDFITDQSPNFIATEIIREKLIRFLGDELPYVATVKIVYFLIGKKKYYNINSLILVRKHGQKKIIIGNKGNKIKRIGIEARMDMEKIFATKVYLKLWVKIDLKK